MPVSAAPLSLGTSEEESKIDGSLSCETMMHIKTPIKNRTNNDCKHEESVEVSRGRSVGQLQQDNKITERKHKTRH